MSELAVGVMPFVSAGMSDPVWVAEFARAVESTTAESIWTYEHVALPGAYTSVYPYGSSGTMTEEQLDDDRPDPLLWLQLVAAHTTRVRLGTGLMVLPLHNPLILAKQLATLDRLSGGRVTAGFGIGWLAEEYDALGVPFAQRGSRADEYLQVLRKVWAPGTASFDGRFHRFYDLHVNPKPVQPGGVPIVMGGHSAAAMRRAARYADGIFLLSQDVEAMGSLIDILHDEASAAGRTASEFEITADAPRDRATTARYRELGITRVILPLPADDLGAMRAEIMRYFAEVIEQ